MSFSFHFPFVADNSHFCFVLFLLCPCHSLSEQFFGKSRRLMGPLNLWPVVRQAEYSTNICINGFMFDVVSSQVKHFSFVCSFYDRNAPAFPKGGFKFILLFFFSANIQRSCHFLLLLLFLRIKFTKNFILNLESEQFACCVLYQF